MKRTLRVLNIEDSERDVALLWRHLSRAGYELVSERVETAAAMKTALETSKWDIVLCDYSMPQFSALDALETLRGLARDIPFIIISGTIGEEAAVAAMRAGAADYLMKDNLTRLAPTIERELQETQHRRARRLAEAALRESEDRYRDLVEHSNDLICTHDLEGRILSVNQAAARGLGYDRAYSLIGRNVREALLPEYRERFLTYIAELRQKGCAHGLMTVVSEQGEKRIWEYTNTLRTEGVAVPIVRGLAHDVTERKRAEKALRQSEEHYRVLFNSNPQPIWVYDVETYRFLDVNDSAIRNYGYSRAEFLAMSIKDIRPPEQLPELLEHLRQRPKDWSDFEAVQVWKHKKKNGQIIDVEVTSHRISLAGRLARLVLAVDVTERKKAAAELQLKREELAAMTQQLWQASKLATMGELAASVAHELNNPLATVALRTESLLMPLPEDDLQRPPLEVISQEVDRMATLVNNLLQFSRRSHRQVSTIDLREEISNSIEFVHYHLRNRRIEIVREFAPDLPTVQADRQQLRQLFLNLLTNASDAMAHGGTLTLRVHPRFTDGEADAVVIEFADTGEGIAPDDLSKIWEPFFTTKPEGRGTGLGLAICRRVVEEHAGTIEIDSEAAKGTIVRITFPATSNGEVIHLQ